MKKHSQVVMLSQSSSVTCISDSVEHGRSHCPACISKGRSRGGCRGCTPTPLPSLLPRLPAAFSVIYLVFCPAFVYVTCQLHRSLVVHLLLRKILDPTLKSHALFVFDYLLTAQLSCPFQGYLITAVENGQHDPAGVILVTILPRYVYLLY